MNEAKIASARNMLARKYPVNDIADITGLSVKKIEELAREMETADIPTTTTATELAQQ